MGFLGTLMLHIGILPTLSISLNSTGIKSKIGQLGMNKNFFANVHISVSAYQTGGSFLKLVTGTGKVYYMLSYKKHKKNCVKTTAHYTSQRNVTHLKGRDLCPLLHT